MLAIRRMTAGSGSNTSLWRTFRKARVLSRPSRPQSERLRMFLAESGVSTHFTRGIACSQRGTCHSALLAAGVWWLAMH